MGGKLGHRHCGKPLSYRHRSKADVRLASSNDDLVYGHFPNNTVFPQCIQTRPNFCGNPIGSQLLTCRTFFRNKTFLFVKIESWNFVRFHEILNHNDAESFVPKEKYGIILGHVTNWIFYEQNFFVCQDRKLKFLASLWFLITWNLTTFQLILTTFTHFMLILGLVRIL